jgi:RNA polymerase sigma factor (TIGR02999 family)
MDGSFYSDKPVWTEPNCRSAEYLFSTHYDELLDLARRIRRRRIVTDTYLTGDLLHDAYLKLNDGCRWNEKDHFLASMALALRHTLVSHARRRQASKRGGDDKIIPLDDASPADWGQTDHFDRVLDIDACLSELAKQSPRLVQVVDCRFFAGYTEEETAALLGVTSRTVRRDWEKARIYFRLRFEAHAETAAP